MANQNNVLRGSAAGAAGGLIGAVVMGWFMTGPGNEIEGAIDRVVGKPVGPTPHGANAALMVADAFVGVAGKRLPVSRERRLHKPYISYSAS